MSHNVHRVVVIGTTQLASFCALVLLALGPSNHVAGGSVPLAVADCIRLAKAPSWTGVSSCNPPPDCPLAGSTSRAGPFQCSRSGQVTTLSINFKSFDRRKLVGSIPTAWANLASLRTLALTGNPLMGGVVPSAFGQLNNLRNLDLSNNPKLCGSIPKALASSNTLTSVRLQGSGIRTKLADFNRPNNEGNPLQLVISKDKPEVCQDFKVAFPILVAVYYPSPTTGKLVPTTPPDC